MIIAIDARSLENPKTGVGRYLSNLLKYWRQNKEYKFVLYFKDAISDIDAIKSDNFEPKLLKNPLGFSSNFFFQHFLLPYNIKKDKIDFFFSPFYLKPFYCPSKSSVTLHDISYEAHGEWLKPIDRFVLGFLSKISAKTADIIFTVSDFSKSEIERCYKISPSRIMTTSLAVDDSFEKISDDKEIGKVKKKYGIGEKFILCVGSIFTRRHIPEVIEAFEKIAVNHDNYQLLIVGRNCTYPFIDINVKIESANKSLKRNAVVQTDFVSEDELMALYSACEFAVYISDYEGFGLPVIEAQFFGKPVVTSYNSSLVEVGDSSVEFVKENTTAEIYKSFERLVTDNEYMKNLAELGKKNIKRFSWRKCAEKILNAILAQ